MSLQIRIYDRTGLGLRLPEGWWIDLEANVPALVNRAVRIDLPCTASNAHPQLDPEILRGLHRSIDGAQWLS